MCFPIMHIVSKFQFFIHIFAMVKLKKTNPKFHHNHESWNSSHYLKWDPMKLSLIITSDSDAGYAASLPAQRGPLRSRSAHHPAAHQNSDPDVEDALFGDHRHAHQRETYSRPGPLRRLTRSPSISCLIYWLLAKVPSLAWGH